MHRRSILPDDHLPEFELLPVQTAADITGMCSFRRDEDITVVSRVADRLLRSDLDPRQLPGIQSPDHTPRQLSQNRRPERVLIHPDPLRERRVTAVNCRILEGSVHEVVGHPVHRLFIRYGLSQNPRLTLVRLPCAFVKDLLIIQHQNDNK